MVADEVESSGKKLRTSKPSEDDVFINFVHPDNARTKRTRKTVRSHASRSSASARKATIAAKRNKSLTDDTSTSNDGRKDSYPRGGGKTLKEPTSNTLVPWKSTSETSYDMVKSSLSGMVSVLGQGRVDPFAAFATAGVWDDSFPRLIDIYLSEIAPPLQIFASSDDCYGRELLRKELWPDTMRDSSLFYTNMLVAAAHESHRRQRRTDAIFVALLRQLAIQNINQSLAGATLPSNATIAAVSILAAFELQFGDFSTFDTHMKGLQTMVTMRGGLYSRDLPNVVRSLALSSGFDLCMIANMKPYFRPAKLIGMEDITDRRPGPLPPAFNKMKELGLLHPTILVLVSEVSLFRCPTPNAVSRLENLGTRLTAWSMRKYLGSDYCAFQSSVEDDIALHAHAILRGALLCLVYEHWGKMADETTVELPGYDSRWLQLEMIALHPEPLTRTFYADLTLWALFVICAHVQQVEIRIWATLQQMTKDRGLDHWPKAAVFLEQYYKLDEVFRAKCNIVSNQLETFNFRGQVQSSLDVAREIALYPNRAEVAITKDISI